MKTIPVLFGVNDQYVPVLLTSMVSLIAHTDTTTHYRLIVLNDGLTPVHQQQLTDLAQDNVQVDLVSMTDKFKQVLANDQGTLRGEIQTMTIFFRLFIADLLPEYDQVVYLDADTIINTDIAALATMDLHHNLLAATRDVFASDNPATAAYIQTVLGIPTDQYFNSGVLVMNLQGLRAMKFSQKFMQAHATTLVTPVAPDQDYLNALCAGRVQALDATWNAMPMAPALAAPKLIHYCLFEKPWHYADVRYHAAFWQAAQATPYEADFKQQLAAYTPAMQEHDQVVAKSLIAQTVKVAAAGHALVPA
ncbi:glycosyltransferase family 8 protein [Lactiplantibacillus daowaiensis]|uniref:Glycosyltransferase family 8 protein n=1 Tax=Lactiplantibacillus daowaiensis TaxID=2559918 RepID=A0ABW1S0E3_9LACO|nr:glycosyltransferase family 8 protein [Lactiplantibacillus daowaiensis]